MIALDRVGKAYAHDVVALQDISLSVGANEIVCLLGPSGCGKSTVLNLIAGFEFPTTGTVSLDGIAVRKPGPDRGVVFQEHALFPWLTVIENIAFGRKLRNGMEDEKHYLDLVDKYVGWMGLRGFEHRYPKELSGGMRQRAAIARVLVNEPKVLLMDEPFAALDAQTRASMQTLVLNVWERLRTTILFITHDIDEAVFLGDRILVMTARPGRIKEVIPVAIERPRSFDVVLSPAFTQTKARILKLLREESPPLETIPGA
ncbi:MAG TPA: ABC transporter ATP-binding protein [Blastocatellia bacterium]|nr:ABC transporter ATP-binding protein [Blastocatellia bacterium]